jgi:feruloyl-CoA synthase
MGFDALLPHLERERQLRETFFRRLKFLWYAGASMQPKTWRALEQLAIETIGQRILIVTGLGMTETSPIALFGNLKANGPGIVGVPVPGIELKLVAHEDKLEARYRGPNVTPGYWRDSGATAEAFDDEGFFASGDLLEFVDPKDPAAGLRFEGRLSDDFKLDSGTRVHASALRLTALEALRPLVSDVVIVGANRPDVRMLIFPDWEHCAREFGFDAAMATEAMAMVTALRAAFKDRLAALRDFGTGSSNRIVAGLLVLIKPSAAAGELTEKGTINARVLQRNRPELLELLFGDVDNELIIR